MSTLGVFAWRGTTIEASRIMSETCGEVIWLRYTEPTSGTVGVKCGGRLTLANELPDDELVREELSLGIDRLRAQVGTT
ncbi:hypothetical protein [Glycomyces buryatensis]|uniref:Uncharacterized protein n=1 Tax=Glycomyces buryatensis TaxID=2570927 RepID=A0A4S8QI86_9ACTN|nr:hypothetical protein [Glycomyces buryatensis]THV43461.1 hypothetical protein FAB82_00960 [Glycomyces buryatensis]